MNQLQVLPKTRACLVWVFLLLLCWYSAALVAATASGAIVVMKNPSQGDSDNAAVVAVQANEASTVKRKPAKVRRPSAERVVRPFELDITQRFGESEVLRAPPLIRSTPSMGPNLPPTTQPPPVNALVSPAGALQQPKVQRITLVMRDTPIAEVFDMLARSNKVNIVLGPGVAGKISVNLHDVTLEDAIRTAAEAGGLVAERRSNTWLIVDRKDLGLEKPSTETGVITHRLMHAPALKVAEILSKHMSRYGKITPLTERNMLVIQDRPESLGKLQELVQQLDAEPPQILLEAMILEIKLDDSESFGVNWGQILGPGSNLSGAIGSRGSAASQAAPSTDITSAITFTGRNSPEFFAAIATSRFTAYLSALAQKGRVRTLSAPRLLVMDGQQAQTQIGKQTGYRTTTTTNNVTTGSVQFLDSGVILRVTPTVDASGRIMLNLQPEVSSVSVTDGIPDKTTTRVNSQVMANDGETVFIGGLISRTLVNSKAGIPGLGGLPVLGGIFGARAESDVRTETVVLITPRLIVPNDPKGNGFSPSPDMRALINMETSQ